MEEVFEPESVALGRLDAGVYAKLLPGWRDRIRLMAVGSLEWEMPYLQAIQVSPSLERRGGRGGSVFGGAALLARWGGKGAVADGYDVRPSPSLLAGMAYSGVGRVLHQELPSRHSFLLHDLRSHALLVRSW